ncbi:ABC transporter ATP-binding protein [Halalkalicoccus salilacus]|uniref:ABC transporter ATP-binding protein n=1 Tax=Halalkalicoccus TaxID=332246 RepID=UPI002F969AD0
MIEFENVTKVYPDGTRAVENLSFRVEEGTTTVLVGPSGCGKTTTMKLVNRLEEPTEGTVYYDGTDTQTLDATDLRREIGYVIQEVGLFDHMTVGENVATVPELKGWERERIDERVEELLELVDLPPEEYRDQYPTALSGGQRQRVGVARALAADPNVLLMDEPFGALDPITREDLQDEFLEIQEKIHTTILFVTHSIDEALKMGDRIAIFDMGELVQYGTPNEILSRPANGFVEEFIGDDRTLKRLGLIRVEEVMEPVADGEIRAVDDEPSAGVVAPEITLDSALSRMVQEDVDALSVRDGDGRLVGRLTRERIQSTQRAHTE